MPTLLSFDWFAIVENAETRVIPADYLKIPRGIFHDIQELVY